MATIYLIRHGQAQFGLEDYDALSPVGMEQAKYLGEVLKQRNVVIDKVYSGNMKRHLQTAENCLNGLGFDASKIIQHEGWNEFDHRDVIAKYDTRYTDIKELGKDVMTSSNPKQKIQEVLVGAVSRWTSGASHDYNETWPAFCERVENGLHQVTSEAGKKDTVFVFTSGGAISVALKKILGLSVEKTFELQLFTANASVTKIKTTSRGLHLLSFNDHTHFEGDKKQWLTFR